MRPCEVMKVMAMFRRAGVAGRGARREVRTGRRIIACVLRPFTEWHGEPFSRAQHHRGGSGPLQRRLRLGLQGASERLTSH